MQRTIGVILGLVTIAVVVAVIAADVGTPMTGVARVHADAAGPEGRARSSTTTGAASDDAGVADAASGSLDQATLETVSDVLALTPSASTSVGGPNTGHLLGGVPLPLRGPGFLFGTRRSVAARFGTVEMVQALMHAAARVQTRLPGSELTIHDLGLEPGGAIPHHGSHRAGRDVDVLFYALDASGGPRAGIGVPIEPDGHGVDYRDLSVTDDDTVVRIDLPRSWAFVAAILEYPGVSVQRIFVVEHIRTMLLEYARGAGASMANAATVERFADVSCQPEYPHDDHFHFRFFCSPEDIRAGCQDGAPFYPWQRERLRREGLAPVMQVRSPSTPRAQVTTDAAARVDAGVMAPEVVAFLARRAAWRRQPHPGRTYCR